MREDEIKLHYRYPGSKPFETTERHLFFGRESDADKFYRLVKIHPLVVLYSKSGMGKSSLINASIIPLTQNDAQFEPLRIRFEAYTEGKKDSPVDILRKKIAPNGSVTTFLDKLIKDEPSLWHDFKEFQITQHKNLLLIFDQFEELFTYPETAVREFKRQLDEALFTQIPDRYAAVLEQQFETGIKPLNNDQIQLLQTLPETKIIIAIRSDRKYLLDKLADSIPDIQKTGYELTPLDTANARLAITRPAQIEDPELATPPFSYDEDALQVMLNFLTKDGQQKVEPFQLQILCNALEHKITSANQILTRDDLGDVSKIIENYYENQLLRIEDPREREAARHLIEDGLILEEEERRLTLYEGQIQRDYPIKPQTLSQLVNCHLLRSEPSDSGGFMYELSHDSLVEPVLEAKARHQETLQKAEEEKRKKEEAKQRERERREQEAELARQQAIAEQERALREEAQQNLRRARMWTRIATGALVVLLVLGFYTLNFYMESMGNTGKMLEKEEKFGEAIKIYSQAQKLDFFRVWSMKENKEAAATKQKIKQEFYVFLNQADTLFSKGEQFYLDALEQYKKADSTGYTMNNRAREQRERIENDRARLFSSYLRRGDELFDTKSMEGYQFALEQYKLADRSMPNQEFVQEKIRNTQAKLREFSQ